MSKAVKGLNPKILIWAREQTGHSVEDVAAALKRGPEDIEAWESGERAPTYVQLETLAYRLYKRPIAVFFFPTPPDDPDPRSSFRTLPDAELNKLNSDVRFKIRKAQAFQLSLRELSDGKNPAPRKIFRDITIRPEHSVAQIAGRIRDYLGISLEEQSRWRRARVAVDRWRDAIQEVGVYVFKDTMTQAEVSGFCLDDTEFPVIYVNNSTPFTRQIFTLFHELAHILVHSDGITKQDDTYIRQLRGTAREVEVFCNALSAEFLVPSQDFDKQLRRRRIDLDGGLIEGLADHYVVSREVVLRRLKEIGVVSRKDYEAKVREWAEEREETGSSRRGRNYYNTHSSYLGEKYLSLAFSRYYQGKLSIEQLAEHLDVKASNVLRFEPLRQ